jgi:mannose-6-phosphate isomerase
MEINMPEQKEEDHRPWGYYKVLDDSSDCKVKRIVVYPEKRLSLQRHKKRDEHWFVLAGNARITLNEKIVDLVSGECVDIKRGVLHRVENTGQENLSFIEVQTGDYFGEDDIERIEDDFGRE